MNTFNLNQGREQGFKTGGHDYSTLEKICWLGNPSVTRLLGVTKSGKDFQCELRVIEIAVSFNSLHAPNPNQNHVICKISVSVQNGRNLRRIQFNFPKALSPPNSWNIRRITRQFTWRLPPGRGSWRGRSAHTQRWQQLLRVRSN